MNPKTLDNTGDDDDDDNDDNDDEHDDDDYFLIFIKEYNLSLNREFIAKQNKPKKCYQNSSLIILYWRDFVGDSGSYVQTINSLKRKTKMPCSFGWQIRKYSDT